MSLAAQSQPNKSQPQTPPEKPPATSGTQTPGQKAPAPAPKKDAVPPKAAAPAKTVPTQAKPAAGKATAKPKQTASKATAAEKKPETVAAAPSEAHKRDPFLALVGVGTNGPAVPVRLPPGPAGLQVSTLRVDGVVRSGNGMLVVITSPQQRTYFLRQGARLFDGRIEQITMDAVTFSETGKDPFGKPIQRTVVKRVYASAGEQ
jgi:hypothetical protein